MTDANSADHAPVLDATEARQGRRGRHVLWILVISLALVVIALFGAWAMHARQLASTEHAHGRQGADASAFQAPAAPAKQTDAGSAAPQ
jgi:hypothetical protein